MLTFINNLEKFTDEELYLELNWCNNQFREFNRLGISFTTEEYKSLADYNNEVVEEMVSRGLFCD